MIRYISLLLTLLFHTVSAQPDEGAIRTQNGILLFFNWGVNSHTLNLDGEVNLRHFPMIEQNGLWFQFFTENKAEFGNDSESILISYMNWEVDYLNKEIDDSIKATNELLQRKSLDINFWKFESPFVEENYSYTPVVATYFLDFVKNDLVYRLSYGSITGNDSEARVFLFDIIDNFRFYNQGIDMDKLQKRITLGQNYYD